ncbi:hypothetical protein ACLI4Q_06965 [Natrialbaceae archaeon A-CW1-1]
MTTIQQVLVELETDYLGHPYYVSGHALFNALSPRVDERTRRALQVSHGQFTPAEYGAYPDAHSRSGYAGVLGKSLPPVERYDDCFLYRDPAQRWLLDKRPREMHNTHDLHSHGGRLAFASQCHVGRPPEMRNSKRSVQWFLQWYLHTDGGEGILPLSAETLDGLQVGGGRNYGFGELSLVETRTVDLDAVCFDRLEAADAYVIELVTPYVLASEQPGADEQSIPWWWDSDGESTLRRREERLVVGANTYRLQTVDHGQRVVYTGDDPIRTAKTGLRRTGTHAKYGFGEFRVRPASDLDCPASWAAREDTTEPTTGDRDQGVQQRLTEVAPQ